jgi:methylaspartate mutase epsilon subunit
MDETESVGIPTLAESADYIMQLPKAAAVDVLRAAKREARVAIQPRCGVGGHDAMLDLLRTLEAQAAPDILTITIDSHTRLKDFELARRTLAADPARLNGYPLVAHGWQRGRELNEAVAAPLEIRHGSPDAKRLFGVAIASGITSFEGGGIAYNLPYSKDVPLADSLSAWREIDATCGELARDGIVVDRELFGTLTAVLVPPSISLAVTVLEAVAAVRQGVRCVSIAYPQGGEVIQDVAALRCIDRLAARYLPADVEVYAVLHEFMGAFPRDRMPADELIFYGAMVARLGAASKLINKTRQEAHGVPDARTNAEGILTARLAQSDLLGFVQLDVARIEEEAYWIEQEVSEIVEPVLSAPNLEQAIIEAFAHGSLDIPFSASRHARSEVIPKRDPSGAIRYLMHGGLPFSPETVGRNRRLVGEEGDPKVLMERLTQDVHYFSR